MKVVVRLFFRTLRAVLGPILLLGNWLTRPKGVVRPPAAQQAVDARTGNLALYHFPTCPFCLKTRRTLRRLSLDVELRNAQHDDAHRAALVEACVELDDDVMADYLDGKEHLGTQGGTVANDQFFLTLGTGVEAAELGRAPSMTVCVSPSAEPEPPRLGLVPRRAVAQDAQDHAVLDREPQRGEGHQVALLDLVREIARGRGQRPHGDRRGCGGPEAHVDLRGLERGRPPGYGPCLRARRGGGAGHPEKKVRDTPKTLDVGE